jgi:uncharacterized membrane protein
MGYSMRVDDGIIYRGAGLLLKNILGNPFGYIMTIFNTLYYYLNSFVSGFIGESLCWYDITISGLFFKSLVVILITSIIFDNTKLKNGDKSLSFIVIFIVVLLVFTSEYLSWTSVGDFLISGIQGRYFIPLIIPILLLLNVGDLRVDAKNIFSYMFLVMIFVNISVLTTLFVAHL